MTTPGGATPRKTATTSAYNRSAKPIEDPVPKNLRPSAVPGEPAAPAPGPVDRPGKIAKWVTTQYRRIGALLKPIDPICGESVSRAAEAAGLAWERLARENKTVRDIINKLMQTTVTTELLMAHLPIMIAVLTHHVPAFRELVAKSSMAFMAEFVAMPDTNTGENAA